MPKRKSEKEDEEKRRSKIQKLEKRLERYRSREITTPPNSNNHIEQQGQDEVETEAEAFSILEVEEVTDEGVDSLPNEVLMALGDENAQEKGYGEDIHSDITKRMDGILMKGLPKEQKEIITKNLLIPANMMLLEAPKLNNELNAILSSSTKTRDKLLEGRQQDLGLAGASVLYAIHKLSRGEDKIDIIKSLGDASRLLCNLHYEYTNMRKKLISPHLDKSLSLNLKENTRSDFLYTKLDETVKSLAAIKRASSALKPKPQPQTSTSGSKNWYQPPRRPMQGPQARGPARGGHHQPQQRYQPRTATRGQGRRLPPPTGRGRAKYP
ncbi:hypothetical protein MSG28_003333 [Choristoneura fumiferana]|uniref:Uncharacterized protein n=2 Tax=Choristoneura fumiferana TaxID=7141 RepID=A0ACC0KEG9_CHOFU|nr:hypothetical protein MSG28_003333 [Choristoneura fumiferana]